MWGLRSCETRNQPSPFTLPVHGCSARMLENWDGQSIAPQGSAPFGLFGSVRHYGDRCAESAWHGVGTAEAEVAERLTAQLTSVMRSS